MSQNGQWPVLKLSNGVRARIDGRGDSWAECHRKNLGVNFCMQDLDGFFGQVAFAANSGEKLFLEYVPDGYESRGMFYRSFAVVAFFDRKTTFEYAFSDSNRMSLAFYLWICRAISGLQPIPASFFIVSGMSAPWRMSKIHLETAEILDEWMVNDTDWRPIWDAVGLSANRQRLRDWLSKR